MGVPQGSVLGPTQRNLLYNGVLEIELPEGCLTLAYADDLDLIVKKKCKLELAIAANLAIQRIKEWMGKDTQNIEKAERAVEALSIVIPKLRRPKSHKRRILCGVITNIIMYAAPEWGGVVRIGE